MISDSEEGGYLVPEVISKERPGVLGWVARLFNHSYGWEDFRLADELEKYSKKCAEKMEDDILNGSSEINPAGIMDVEELT